VCWLEPAHQTTATHLLTTGQRLAQEAVGLAHLSHNADWLADLR
jgi:hypothetical protein